MTNYLPLDSVYDSFAKKANCMDLQSEAINCLLLYELSEFNHSAELKEQASTMLTSLVENTSYKENTHLDHLFTLGCVLELLNQKPYFEYDLSEVIINFDQFARDATYTKTLDTSILIESMYLFLRFKSSKSRQHKNNIKHTLLRQTARLYKLIEGILNSDTSIQPLFTDDSIHILINYFYVLYKFHESYIFPARSKYLIDLLLNAIVLTSGLDANKKILLRNIINRIGSLPLWAEHVLLREFKNPSSGEDTSLNIPIGFVQSNIGVDFVIDDDFHIPFIRS